MFEHIIDAVGTLLAWPNPLWMLAGVLFGLIIGILPGMAGSVAIALLIPISFTMEPTVAVLFLMAAYSPNGFGGMITSILVNTPGAPENAATIFDGHPMAKQGRAAAAIGAATASSVIGGFIGFVLLLAALPLAQKVVLAFSYPEFLAMSLVGLSIIALVTDNSFVKGLTATGVGLLIAFIGLDPVTGQPRFTFGEAYLWDGIDIVPVLIGLFAGAELLALFGSGSSVSEADMYELKGEDGKIKRKYPVLEAPITFMEGVRSTFRHWGLVLRGSVLGTIMGVIPGIGGSTAGFLAYAQAKQTSKRSHEFGKGNVEGVIAVESANDAKDGGSLLPTLAFGIPGTVGMAVLLGALIMHGIPAGPGLLVEHIDIVYVLILSMIVAKLVAPFFVWFLARYANQLGTLRPEIFTPLILVAVLVGTYTIRFEILDVYVALFFGYLGYAMRRYGYSRIALCIALVLGGLVERSYVQTLSAFGSLNVMIERPVSLVLVLILLMILLVAVRQNFKAAAEAAAPMDMDSGAEIEVTHRRQWGRILLTGLLFGFGLLIMNDAIKLGGQAAQVPMLVVVPYVVVTALYFLAALLPKMADAVAQPIRQLVPRP